MSEGQGGNGSSAGLPEASLGDSAKFVVAGLLPTLVRGLFSPRKSAMKLLTAVDADARTTQVLQQIRAKHGGQGVKLLGGRIVTLWGPDAIRQVLDQSADVYASDGGAKGKGMGHFQPEALTVSRGEEWEDRRRFNEHVLATSESLHPDAARFCSVVAEEVPLALEGDELEWEQWEELFDRITLRVIFGDKARENHELTEALEKLMGQANRLVGLSPNNDYYEFYGMLEKQLQDPEPGSLLARFAEAPATDTTRVVHQIPHWIFAMRDTLGANAYRALALAVADEDVLSQVRLEIDRAGGDLTDPSVVGGLSYLEGVLQEAMRLWPTVPLLARETTRDTELLGEQLDEGTQVMIVNTFVHRDDEAIPDANRMRPERWMDGSERDPRFNHLAGGRQYCPGIPLVLLIGKAVIAQMVTRFDLTLDEPSLDPSGDLPHMLDFYEIEFDVAARST